MCVIARNIRDAGQHLAPAAARVEKLSDAQHGWLAAFGHVKQRWVTLQNLGVIRQLHPTVCELLAVENIQCLKDPSQNGNPREPVLVERPARLSLEFVKCPMRDATEQLARVLIPQFPKVADFQERLHRSRSQTLLNAFA